MTTTQPDPCSSDPCQNGGTCVSLGPVGIVCDCPEGYTGDFCEDVSIVSFKHIHIKAPLGSNQNQILFLLISQKYY